MELHYVDADSDEIWEEMTAAYSAAGGDILYPGDEKEILLRAVQMIAITILAKVDNALKMDTLTYATRDYLKEYGLKRNCVYMEAQAAEAPVTLTMAQTGYARTIPAGTLLTADGAVLWETEEEIALSGDAETIDAVIRCRTAGVTGNGLTSGTDMQFMEGLEGLVSCVTTANASGGVNAEDEEEYRERIRNYGLATVTTGPSGAYESIARAVSSQILDAKALNDGAAEVGVYLILEDGATAADILAAVEAALNPTDTRPLTDHVTVYQATGKPYTLNVKVWYGSNVSLEKPVADVIAEYKAWQDQTVGRAFNPDKLVAMLYQDGCERVQFISGSSGIDGGNVEYTDIPARARCVGTITPTIVNT